MEACTRAARWSVVAAMIVVAAYCTLMVCLNHSWYPDSLHDVIATTRRYVYGAIHRGLALVGIAKPGSHVRFSTYLLLIVGFVPWLSMAILRRGRPADIGLRMPNRYAWRILLVAYLAVLPLLVWMSAGPGFADTYLAGYKRGRSAFLSSYFVNMLVEHLFFHGIMLAAFRASGRWPNAPRVGLRNGGAWSRALQLVGLAQSAHHECPAANGLPARITRWLGIADGCGAAIIGSGVLFYWIHVGKNPREALLSLPGGIASAWLAYRTNSALTPLILHLATAGTACAIMVLRDG